MTKDEMAALLVGFRNQFSWLMAQAAEYESGRPGAVVENGIYGAHICAETAMKFRRQADNLAVIISAYEKANEEIPYKQGDPVG
jgi:hypothetical protein